MKNARWALTAVALATLVAMPMISLAAEAPKAEAPAAAPAEAPKAEAPAAAPAK